MTLPENLKPATWGCSHGVDLIGSAIRDAQLRMSRSKKYPHGDREASWAGHCFIFIGDYNFGTVAAPGHHPAIVEAQYPKVVISRADRHPDAIWATGEPLTANQRKVGTIAALKMVGTGYDIRAYGYFIARVIKLHIFKDAMPLLTDPLMLICSGTVVKDQEDMGIDISELPTAATDSPDFISPADCLRWGLDNGWMSSDTPKW